MAYVTGRPLVARFARDFRCEQTKREKRSDFCVSNLVVFLIVVVVVVEQLCVCLSLERNRSLRIWLCTEHGHDIGIAETDRQREDVLHNNNNDNNTAQIKCQHNSLQRRRRRYA